MGGNISDYVLLGVPCTSIGGSGGMPPRNILVFRGFDLKCHFLTTQTIISTNQ